MKNKKGNIVVIAIIIVIVAITAGVIGWMFAKRYQEPVIKQAKVTQEPIAQTQKAQSATTQAFESNNASQQGAQSKAVAFDKNALQSSVFAAVDGALKARYQSTKDPGYVKWDKKVDITSIDVSQKAAKGKWWKSDAWDWIAWQQEDNSWKVLLSFDGFNCQELNSVPSQFNAFFKDVIFPSFTNGKYCY